MGYQEFARDELTRAGLFDKDSDYGGRMGEAIMELVEKFAEQGHSGFSAGMAVHIIQRIFLFEPITPLTGGDDEWTEVTDGCWQNKRCPRVFKDTDGRAYDIGARIFRDPDGVCFTSQDSRQFIAFPYTPVREYVDVPASSEENPA